MTNIIYDRRYYLCEGYKAEISDKKIIYYHQPKTGGTSVTNIFLSLFDKPYRILGTQIKNDHTTSCHENFMRNFEKIKNNEYDFIAGHIQFLDFFNDRISITTIRDPVERAISHYNMLFERKLIDNNTKLEDCFSRGLIPKNPITQMFSCKDSNNTNLDTNNKNLAINILKKINLIVSFEEIDSLINYIISTYDFPNILYQRLQQNKKNYFKERNMSVDEIIKYNQFDLEIFNLLKKQKLFFKFPKSNIPRSKPDYFIYSVDLKINDQNKLITQKSKFNTFVNFLEKHSFHIERVI